ncbi:MAG: 16S rRNA (uracil(1498)-N(3))-methyltransferase, partial [Bacteroidales bacterium]|nr:16S rRNA (uracil(1498)-N(3))-methyltransferase [Bacteroidales bacterium]
SGQAGTDALKLICYCDDVTGLGVEKINIVESLHTSPDEDIIVMIGPEGDFSRSEVEQAVAGGWIVTSLGESRLRIETAAVVATAAVYLEKSR